MAFDGRSDVLLWAIGRLERLQTKLSYFADQLESGEGSESEWVYAAEAMYRAVYDETALHGAAALGSWPAWMATTVAEWWARDYLPRDYLMSMLHTLLKLICPGATSFARRLTASWMCREALDGNRHSVSSPEVRVPAWIWAAEDHVHTTDYLEAELEDHLLSRAQARAQPKWPAELLAEIQTLGDPASRAYFLYGARRDTAVKTIKVLIAASEACPTTSDERYIATFKVLTYTVDHLELFAQHPKFVGVTLAKLAQFWPNRERFASLGTSLEGLFEQALHEETGGVYVPTLEIWVRSVCAAAHATDMAQGNREAETALPRMLFHANLHMIEMQDTLWELGVNDAPVEDESETHCYELRSGRKPRGTAPAAVAQDAVADVIEYWQLIPRRTSETHEVVVMVRALVATEEEWVHCGYDTNPDTEDDYDNCDDRDYDSEGYWAGFHAAC